MKRRILQLRIIVFLVLATVAHQKINAQCQGVPFTLNHTWCEGTFYFEPIMFFPNEQPSVVSVNGLPPGIYYNWAPGQNVQISGNPYSAGVYMYTITVICGNGNMYLRNGTITVNQPSTPPGDITGNTFICNGSSTVLTAVGGTLGTSGSYQWGTGTTVGSNIIAGQTAVSITVNPTTTTSYWVRRVDPPPCSASTTGVTKEVTVNQKSTAPTFINASSSLICNPTSVTLTAEGGLAGTNSTYQWGTGTTVGSNIIIGQNAVTLTVSPTATTTYWVRRSDPAPCNAFTSGVTKLITVNQPSTPPTDISGTTLICNGSSTTLTAFGGASGTNGSYEWGTGATVGNNIIPGQTTQSIIVSPSSTTTYWVRRVAPAPCNTVTSGVTKEVTVNQKSTAPTSISASSSLICNPTSVTLTAVGGTEGTNSTYEWGTGAAGSNIIAGKNTITITESPSSTTTYWVRRKDPAPCNTVTAGVTTLITVNQPSTPPTDISGTTLICSGSSTTLTAFGGASGTNGSYEWGTGATVGSNIIAGQTAVSIIVSPSSTTSYWVRRKDPIPCNTVTSGVIKEVTVNQKSTAPTSISASSSLICNPTAVTLTAVGGTEGTGSTYQWGTGTTVGINIISGQTTVTITVNPTATTTYWVRRSDPLPCNSFTAGVTKLITVNQPSSPPVDITGNTFICNGSSTTLTAFGGTLGTSGSYQWGTGTTVGNNIIAGQTAVTITVSPSSTTSYWVRRVDPTPCNTVTSGAIVEVTVNQSPTPATAGPDQTGAATCGLTTVTLAANTPSAGTGIWTVVSGAGGSFNDPNSPTTTFTGTEGSSYTLRWTITNAPCPPSSDDVVIKFNQIPTLATAGPDQTEASTCGLTSLLLEGNIPSVGTGLWTILAGSGGSFSNSSFANSTFSGIAGTTYTLRWTISKPPCTASQDDVVIKFNRNPTIANAGPDQTGPSTCGKTSVTLAGNAAIIGTGNWTIVNGNGGSLNNPANPTTTFTGNTSVPYTLRWTITNSPCIASFDDVNILLNPGPTITSVTSSNPTTCTGTEGKIILNGLQANIAYLVDFNKNGVPQPQKSITTNGAGSLTITALGKGKYDNLSVTLSSCQGTTNTTINLTDPTPLAVPTTSQQTTRSECASAFPITLSVNPVSGQEMNWYKDGILFINNQNSPSISGAGVYEVEAYNPTSKCSSATKLKFTVTSKPTPTLSAVAPKLFCAKDTVTLNFNSTPTGSTFNWKNDNKKTGLTDTLGTGNISFIALANTTANSETSKIKVTPTLNLCKGPEVEYLLTLKPTPQLVTIPPFSECSKLPFDLVDFSISPVISGAQNYSWSNAGVPELAASGTGQIPIFTPTYNSTGSNIVGNISYTVTVAGCVSTSKSFPVKVFTHPNLGMTITENSGALPNDYVICQSDSVTVSTTVTKSLPPYTYMWSTNQTSGNFTEAVSATGEKYYSVAVTDDNGCKNSTFKKLTINNYPAVSLSFVENSGSISSDAKICKKDSIAFTAGESNGSSPTYAFAWNVNNLTTKSIKIAPDSTRTYVVSVTNSGCRTTASKVVEVFALPVANISPTIATICSGNSQKLAASGGTSYKWSPGNQTKDTLTISPSAQTTYAVTVTDANSCLATTSMTVSVLNSPRIDSIAGKKEITCGEKIDLVCVNNCSTCTYSWSTQSTTKSIQVSSAGKYSVDLTDTLTKCVVTKSIDITGGGDIPKIDSIKKSTEAPICGSGMLELSVKDSTGYTYVWNAQGNKTSKIQVSSNGTYIVTVTNTKTPDCKKELSWVVNNFKPAVTSTPKVNNSKCQANDGSILLEPLTGTPGFTYRWADVGTDTNFRKNLKAGDYALTITDKNGCQETQIVKVNNEGLIPTFSLAADTNSPICDATTKIKLNTNNCQNCGQFSWNDNSSSNFTAISKNGTYVVTVSNTAGCSTIDSIVVNNFKTPVTTSVSVVNSKCNDANGSITVTPITGTGTFKWTWGDGTTAERKDSLFKGTYLVTVTDDNNCTEKKIIVVGNIGSKPTFSIQSSNSNPICDTSSTVQLSIEGCKQCSTYLWSNDTMQSTNTLKKNGMYSVTVTNDSNCVASREYTVDNFKTPVSSIVKVKGSTCQDANGEIQLTVETGTSPYTYKWNDNANLNSASRSNLGAGNYSVTITDFNTCTKIDKATVINQGEKPNFTITPDITTKICGNDTTLQLLIGNCPGCSYLWDNDSTADTLEVDSNRTYKVTATLGTCSSSSSIEVSNFKTAVSFNLTATAATCNKKNGRITVTPLTGALPFDFVWSVGGPPSSNPSKDSLAPGSYTITVVDKNNCTGIDYVVVPSDESTLSNDSIYLFLGSSTGLYLYPKDSLCYKWVIEDGKGGSKPADCKNGRNDLAYCELPLNPSETGKIALWVSDCDPLGCNRKVTQVRSEIEVTQPRFVSVFPNPTDGLLNIKISSDRYLTYFAEIYDLVGRKLRSTKIDKRQMEVVFNWDLQDLDAGAYLLLLTDEQGEQSQYKLIVQR